ncbi:MAG: hypothetical protein ABIO70_23760 [Pseudomonadota bacterium]
MPEPTSFLTWLRAGYDRKSVVALGLTLGLRGVMGVVNYDLIDWSLGMDWLLVGIWAAMAALLIARIDLRHDLPLLAVGFLGGGVIEWWGTQSVLWVYFTKERPPLWILPAWPVAALAIDRLARILDRACPWLGRAAPAYWLVVPAFVAYMGHFLWIRIHVPASQVVLALMVLVTLVGARPRRDLLLFVAGAALGWFLEYWGTTRYCWTYYTYAKPPLEAVLAHGFATVAFARGVQGFAWAGRLTRRAVVARA